jgi:hypothetical protein
MSAGLTLPFGITVEKRLGISIPALRRNEAVQRRLKRCP